MGQITLKGHPEIDVLLRRSGRAKRLSLRVSQLDGRVTMTLPKWASVRLAQDFAEEKADWISNALARRVVSVAILPGAELPVEGVPRKVVFGAVRSAKLSTGTLVVSESRPGLSAVALLKHLARDRLSESVAKHADAIGRPYGRLTLRDTRSRWGSCSHQGNLMFSWRLILAPPDVLDYVATHEVAHLERMDHSSAFWSVVQDLCPDYETPRAWLRREGHALHRYRFETPTSN